MIFGYQESEALGQSLDLIVPEKFRDSHWEGYRNVISTGTTRYGGQLLSVPAQDRCERRVSLEFTVTLVKNDRGEVAGVAAIARDVTESWQREKTLKERVKTLEEQLERSQG